MRNQFVLESKHKPLAPRKLFAKRMLMTLALAGCILAFGLCVGVSGFRITTDMGWIDAFFNASMILTGMGPTDKVMSGCAAAKIFASVYALFSGLLFVTVIAVVLSPVLHRILHTFHLDESDEGK